MHRLFLAVVAVMIIGFPVSAQQARSFSYGAGVSSPTADSGLHLTASAEYPTSSPSIRTRFDISFHDRRERDVFLFAGLTYFPRQSSLAPYLFPYLLGGVGTYTGEDIPLAATAAAGVESNRLPLYVEARLFYAAGIFHYGGSHIDIGGRDLFPSLTLGLKMPRP